MMLVTFMLLSLSLFARNDDKPQIQSLEVIVIDAQTDEPIPAAQVKIKHKKLQTFTDFEGLAKINNLAVGSYDIEISVVSYQSMELKDFQFSENNRYLVVKLKS